MYLICVAANRARVLRMAHDGPTGPRTYDPVTVELLCVHTTLVWNDCETRAVHMFGCLVVQLMLMDGQVQHVQISADARRD